MNKQFASAAFSCFDHPENQNRSEKIGRGNLPCLGNHNHWTRGMPFISACFSALDISCTGTKQERQTLRIRPEDVWVVVEVAGGSTVAWSSSGRTSVTPLLLSRGSPFSRASRLLPSTAPNASRFKPSSKSATHMNKKQLYMYWHDSHSFNLKYKRTKYNHKLLLVKFYHHEWDQTRDPNFDGSKVVPPGAIPAFRGGKAKRGSSGGWERRFFLQRRAG